ncbi:uncharacterized protein LOC144086684 isoform X2 [Stigmatopora argus]
MTTPAQGALHLHLARDATGSNSGFKSFPSFDWTESQSCVRLIKLIYVRCSELRSVLRCLTGTKQGKPSVISASGRLMSTRPHRGKYVSWNMDRSIPASARPGIFPNKKVHVSALHGGISNEEDFENHSADRSDVCHSSHRSGSPSLRLEGWFGLPVSGKFRWAGKKHRGCGNGNSIAYWELEKENAHLLMVDLVLEMLEVIQWTETKRMSSEPDRQQLHETDVDELDQQTQIDLELTRLEGRPCGVPSCLFSPLCQ